MKSPLSYFYNRKLRVDILTLFLILLMTSSIVIGLFSYLKNRRAIFALAVQMVERVSTTVRERILSFIGDLQEIAKLAEVFITHIPDFNPIDSRPFTALMYSILKAYPNIESFYIATPEGRFLELTHMHPKEASVFLSDPAKPLPLDMAYALRTIDKSEKEGFREKWYYLNDSFEILTQEVIHSPTFDPRKRSWYRGAENNKKLYWSDIYRYNVTQELGISVSLPLYDNNNELSSVIGADLPLHVLSDFLKNQRISTSGKAFVFKNTGELLFPKGEEVYTERAKKAYSIYSQNSQEAFVFKDSGINLLGYVHQVQFENTWLIVIVVPLTDFFRDIIVAQKETLLITVIILILSGFLVVYFSKRISKPIVLLAKEIDKIKHLDLESEIRVPSHIREINLLDTSIASMRVMLRSFGRYVPKDIVRQLMQRGQEITLGGENRHLTVLFSDIADFTTISESHPIETVMPLLAAYFDTLSKIILALQGTIDKYIGDSIMAFWGAPIDIPCPEQQACEAALKCQAALVNFNKINREKGDPPLFTRIGIHSGRVIVGNIGTQERMNYTAIGDVVNTAARLQVVNKLYQTSIVISETVYTMVSANFLTRPLDIVTVKGKKERLKIYELVAQFGSDVTAPRPEQLELCELFSQGYQAFYHNQLSEAEKIFLTLSQKYPDDVPTRIYLERLRVP